MKLYRFSPITSESQLIEAIKHIHYKSYKLCENAFGKSLPNAGNLAVFCHYDDEYEKLLAIRNKLTKYCSNPKQKYYEFIEPIVIDSIGNIPITKYTHIYIRKPDPYRHHVGDIDFYIPVDNYTDIKEYLQSGNTIKGARIFPRDDLDMIELYNPDIDVLAYLSANNMTEKVHIKLKD